MSSFSKNQYFLIIFTVILTALIYLAPRQVSTAKDAVVPEKAVEFSFEDLLNKAKTTLPEDEMNKVKNFAASVGKDKSNLDSIVKIFEHANMPALAGYYKEKLAVEQPTEKNWMNTGDHYFDAFRVANDSMELKACVEKAIMCYSKVLEINPKNLDAKTDLGVCYTEGTSNPMQGISLLREVLAVNPKHEMAQLNLGFLAVKSGQFEKALARFDTVLTINPKNTEVYSYIGNVYLKKGDKEKAIVNFEKFKSFLKDTLKITQVENYIKQIKSSKEQIN